MKYWFFDGSDVVGPFEPQELSVRPGFAATSLVCPENYSEEEDSWQMAASFPEFHFDTKEIFSIKPPESETNPGVFDEEMNTLLKERSPLGDLDENPTGSEAPSLEIPKKPAKPGPIEDYFNNIKEEDLGNILGIPDPNENSDMNLARAFQTQFEKTNPPSDKNFHVLEKDPFDEFTSEEDLPDHEPALLSSQPFVSAPQDTVTDKPVSASGPLETTLASSPATAPLSIPISKETEEELILSVPGKTTATENNASQPTVSSSKQPKAVDSVSGESPLTNTSQLPILDQPEPQLPKLSGSVAAFPAKNSSASQMPDLSTSEITPSTQPADQTTPASTETVLPEETVKAFPPEHKTLSSTPENNQPEELVPSQKASSEKTNVSATQNTETPEPEDPKEATVRKILEGKLEVDPTPEIAEPIKNVPVEPQVHHVRTRLKQTPEIEAFLTKTQNERIEREKSHKKAMAALSVLVALLAVGAALYLNQTLHPEGQHTSLADDALTQTTQADSSVQDSSATTVTELLPDISVPPPPENITTSSLSDQALKIVQNHLLPGNKGTVVSYLERLYRPQLSQGYTGSWSAEPLHKNTYIVKYRLTKTRMEPIVYIFQADVAAGKLTGALNNITLDLVGKI